MTTAPGSFVRSPAPWAVLGTAGRALAAQPALIALLAVCSFAAARYETFLTPENLLNVLRQNSMAGLLGLGMLLSILSGGIDLSLGALLAAGGVTAAVLSPHGTVVAVAGALAVTGLLGLVNGLLITRAAVQPFVTTLVVNMTVRGVLLAVTAEEPVRVARSAAGLAALGRGWVGPVPVPVVVLFAAYGLGWLLLSRTRFGSHLLAAGENETASRLLGVGVGRVRIISYAVGGTCAGLGGVLLAGRVAAGQPNAGLGWELNAITAVVLGSAGKPFGRPDAGSTLVGVLLIAVTFNVLNLEGGLSPHWQGVLRGLFLVAAVVLQSRAGAVRRLTG